MKTITEYIQKKQISITTDYVDLDLPSGTKWATMNIGAKEGDKPEDWYGLYFSWGETEGYKLSDKHNFNWDNYKFGSKYAITKYNSKDKLTQLETEDDAVYQTTDGKFRMPTDEELDELYQETDNEWVENYNSIEGLNGRLFTSKENKTKSIFIPACCGVGESNSKISSTKNYISIWSSVKGEISLNAIYFFNIKAYGYLRYIERVCVECQYVVFAK